MNHYPEKISKNIKKERLKRGWSQAELGDLLYVKGKQVSNYENEDPNKNTLPPLGTLLKMCDLFECDLGYLIGEDGYSQKTKKLTIAASETGFTEESLQQIRNVMGIFPVETAFNIEAEEYQRMLNNFVSSPQFIKFVIELKHLDDIYRRRCYFDKKYGPINYYEMNTRNFDFEMRGAIPHKNSHIDFLTRLILHLIHLLYLIQMFFH